MTVKVAQHSSFNLVKGVMYSWELRYLVEQHVHHGVMKVESVEEVGGDLHTHTNTLFFNYDQNHVSLVNAGWYNLRVKTFVPFPSHHYDCQLYGHATKICRHVKKGLPAFSLNWSKAIHNGFVQCVAKWVNCTGLCAGGATTMCSNQRRSPFKPKVVFQGDKVIISISMPHSLRC